MDTNIFEKAGNIVKTCDTAYVGVIDEGGFPSVSTVAPINQESIFETYFATTLDANKTKRLQKNNKASVCFHVGGDNITLVGETEIFIDQETKSRFWQDWFIGHFPGGETDPNYCVIKITTKRVSLWVDNEGVESPVDKLLTHS